VAKNDYPYPPDEFDRVNMESRPKEVHAARRGPWSRVWPFLLVIVLIPAIAFAVVYFLGDRLPGRSNSSSPGTTTSQDTPADQPPAAEETLDTPAPEETTPEPETPEAPAIDKTVTITVYNSGAGNEAALRTAQGLQAAGYANASSHGTPNPASPATTTVYYSAADQATTAADIAAILGGAPTQIDAAVAGGGIVVVITMDHFPAS
jgi:cytoskeletal protein RodZ